MNDTTQAPATALRRPHRDAPVLTVTGRDQVAIRAGTVFNGWSFETPVTVPPPDDGLEPGADYAVMAHAGAAAMIKQRVVDAGKAAAAEIIGGFHLAPGGNAQARAGGDDAPAINPCSVWDVDFRPACPSPAGMALVGAAGGRFWCDIYLLGRDQIADGTSRFGVTIADGDSPPEKPGGGHYPKLDYDTASAVMAHHGKQLLSVTEFFLAAFGVTERSAVPRDPKRTGLDAPRTSRFGVMQATGNLWVWGHDGDPDVPRASFLGGSWLYGVHAGSRRAIVGCYWPGHSAGLLGARGRCDHLQPE